MNAYVEKIYLERVLLNTLLFANSEREHKIESVLTLDVFSGLRREIFLEIQTLRNEKMDVVPYEAVKVKLLARNQNGEVYEELCQILGTEFLTQSESIADVAQELRHINSKLVLQGAKNVWR